MRKNFIHCGFWILTFAFVFLFKAAGQEVKPGGQPAPKATPAIVLRGNVETFRLNSKLMAREMPYRVILPANYNNSNETTFYPVVYLLHGLSGHFDNWTDKTKLAEYSLNHPLIVVMPEGNDGWYSDSVSVPGDRYESYIIRELVPEIDKKFRTKTGRAGRAIAGLSMGGYGALKFGLKYPDKFILAGSFSGALGITTIPSASVATFPSVKNVFGEDGSQSRKDNDIFSIIRDTPAEKLKDLPFIYVSCGTEDFLFANNQDFMKLLVEKKVPHEYRQTPGTHSWVFWDEQVQEFLRLSERFFKKQ
jgi:putative tributyrin esterase